MSQGAISASTVIILLYAFPSRTGESVLPAVYREVQRAGIDDLRLTHPVSPVR